MGRGPFSTALGASALYVYPKMAPSRVSCSLCVVSPPRRRARCGQAMVLCAVFQMRKYLVWWTLRRCNGPCHTSAAQGHAIRVLTLHAHQSWAGGHMGHMPHRAPTTPVDTDVILCRPSPAPGTLPQSCQRPAARHVTGRLLFMSPRWCAARFWKVRSRSSHPRPRSTVRRFKRRSVDGGLRINRS
ncbi:hypothetical protein BDZ91DRAFT_551468 [Kalaharituber pfeilii]|nr:hypothetical protein BDZ91DRAFT_551468 [Kalaharituber pfeilii]